MALTKDEALQKKWLINPDIAMATMENETEKKKNLKWKEQ